MVIRSAAHASLMMQDVLDHLQTEGAKTQTNAHLKQQTTINKQVEQQNKAVGGGLFKKLLKLVTGPIKLFKALVKGGFKEFKAVLKDLYQTLKEVAGPVLKFMGKALLMAAAALVTAGAPWLLIVAVALAGGGALAGSKAITNKNARDNVDASSDLEKENVAITETREQAGELLATVSHYENQFFQIGFERPSA